jgi:hypothetical protein
MGSSKMSLLILHFEAKAMGGPWLTLPSRRLGSRTATMFCFKVVAKTAGCIASMNVVVSSQGFGSAMLRVALPRLDFRNWRIADRQHPTAYGPLTSEERTCERATPSAAHDPNRKCRTAGSSMAMLSMSV